jgi:hypothetical protein
MFDVPAASAVCEGSDYDAVGLVAGLTVAQYCSLRLQVRGYAAGLLNMLHLSHTYKYKYSVYQTCCITHTYTNKVFLPKMLHHIHTCEAFCHAASHMHMHTEGSIHIQNAIPISLGCG